MNDTVTAPLVDLHTHILPAVDDGAPDLAAAMAMARGACEGGIVRLAATPHNLRWPPGTDREALEARVAALQRHLNSLPLPLLLVAGAETALVAALPRQIEAGEIVSLNRSRYLLLEPLPGGLPAGLEEILFQVQVRGLVPILAHPERNPDLQRPERLRGLVERGALVQVTAGSLEGLFGPAAQRAAERLLAANLVHVIASDAHDARWRPSQLWKAQQLAARIVGAERALALVSSTPAAILDDLPLDVDPPVDPARPRPFWQRLF